MIAPQLIDLFRVPAGKSIRLKDYDPGWEQAKELKELGKEVVKERALESLKQDLEALSQAQELLWATNIYSVLIVLQAMDTAGKDGIIRHVMTGLNPQACAVYNFKKPSVEELDHTFLWRHMKALPRHGQICIFNRSHYEDVLVVKVHPEFLDTANLPPGKRGKSFWKKRYEDINNFEHHLVRNGTLVLKFFLHISKEEQRRRLLERLLNPDKHWKFSTADLAEREFWDDYQKAYQEALSATSTKWAPWYVIPANHKWVARSLVADILTKAIGSLDLAYPSVTEEKRKALAAARTQLENE